MSLYFDTNICVHCNHLFEANNCLLPSETHKKLLELDTSPARYQLWSLAHQAMTPEYVQTIFTINKMVETHLGDDPGLIFQTKTTEVDKLRAPTQTGSSKVNPSASRTLDITQVADESQHDLQPLEDALETTRTLERNELMKLLITTVSDTTAVPDRDADDLSFPQDLVLGDKPPSTSKTEALTSEAHCSACLLLSALDKSLKREISKATLSEPLPRDLIDPRLQRAINKVNDRYSDEYSQSVVSPTKPLLCGNSPCFLAFLVERFLEPSNTDASPATKLLKDFATLVELKATAKWCQMRPTDAMEPNDSILSGNVTDTTSVTTPPLETIDVAQLKANSSTLDKQVRPTDLHLFKKLNSHTCEPLPANLTSLLNSHLTEITSHILNEAIPEPRIPSYFRSLCHALMCITIEIIAHNPKWTKPHYQVNRGILSQALYNLIFSLSKQEVDALVAPTIETLTRLRKLV